MRADQEVICHGDLGPHNTVFRGEQAVGLIAFEDDVGPGRRLDDFAQAVWGFADLTDVDVPVAEQARKTRLMCDVYGDVTPPEVVEVLTARFRGGHERHLIAELPDAVRVFADLLTWTDRRRLTGR